METKAELKQPYTEEERMDFIVVYNHGKGYTIQEDKDGLKAMGYTAEELAAKERERINNLSMTRGDMFEALILAKGLGKTQLRGMIEAYETDETTKLLYLNRFDEALDFYRGYPIFDLLGEQIGITADMWDEFFETKDWNKLVKVEEEVLINGEVIE